MQRKRKRFVGKKLLSMLLALSMVLGMETPMAVHATEAVETVSENDLITDVVKSEEAVSAGEDVDGGKEGVSESDLQDVEAAEQVAELQSVPDGETAAFRVSYEYLSQTKSEEFVDYESAVDWINEVTDNGGNNDYTITYLKETGNDSTSLFFWTYGTVGNPNTDENAKYSDPQKGYYLKPVKKAKSLTFDAAYESDKYHFRFFFLGFQTDIPVVFRVKTNLRQNFNSYDHDATVLGSVTTSKEITIKGNVSIDHLTIEDNNDLWIEDFSGTKIGKLTTGTGRILYTQFYVKPLVIDSIESTGEYLKFQEAFLAGIKSGGSDESYKDGDSEIYLRTKTDLNALNCRFEKNYDYDNYFSIDGPDADGYYTVTATRGKAEDKISYRLTYGSTTQDFDTWDDALAHMNSLDSVENDYVVQTVKTGSVWDGTERISMDVLPDKAHSLSILGNVVTNHNIYHPISKAIDYPVTLQGRIHWDVSSKVPELTIQGNNTHVETGFHIQTDHLIVKDNAGIFLNASQQADEDAFGKITVGKVTASGKVPVTLYNYRYHVGDAVITMPDSVESDWFSYTCEDRNYDDTGLFGISLKENGDGTKSWVLIKNSGKVPECDGLIWSYDEGTKTLTVSGEATLRWNTDSIFADVVKTMDVEKLAFQNCTLKGVVAYLCNGLRNLREIDCSGLQLKDVESMVYMFQWCDRLEKLNLGSIALDGSRTYGMFNNCDSLSTIYVPANVSGRTELPDPFEDAQHNKYTELTSETAGMTLTRATDCMTGVDLKIQGGNIYWKPSNSDYEFNNWTYEMYYQATENELPQMFLSGSSFGMYTTTLDGQKYFYNGENEYFNENGIYSFRVKFESSSKPQDYCWSDYCAFRYARPGKVLDTPVILSDNRQGYTTFTAVEGAAEYAVKFCYMTKPTPGNPNRYQQYVYTRTYSLEMIDRNFETSGVQIGWADEAHSTIYINASGAQVDNYETGTKGPLDKNTKYFFEIRAISPNVDECANSSLVSSGESGGGGGNAGPSTESPEDEADDYYDDYYADPEVEATRMDLADSALGTAITGAKGKTYDGKAYQPAVKVTVTLTVNNKPKKVTLTEGVDYRVLYEDNIHAGTGCVVIKGNGAYKGEKRQEFTIQKKPVGKLKMIVGSMGLRTSGADASDIPLKIYDGGLLLEEGVDYELTGLGNVGDADGFGTKAGKYTVTVNALEDSDYTGSKAVKVTVCNTEDVLTEDDVTLTFGGVDLSDGVPYTGSAIKPTVTVTHNGKELSSKEFSVKYTNNKEAGTAYVTVTGKKPYSGSVVKTFEITPAEKTFKLKSEIKAVTYNGKLQKPKAAITVDTVAANGKAKTITLKAGKDYLIYYSNNLHATKGEGISRECAKITVKGIGNYADCETQVFEFDILPQQMKKASVKGAQGNLEISYAKKPLVADIDYTVSYGTPDAKGKVDVTLKGKGDFTGEVTKKVKAGMPQ